MRPSIAAVQSGPPHWNLPMHGNGASFEQVEVTIKPESQELTATCAPGRRVEDHVASAIIEARKSW